MKGSLPSSYQIRSDQSLSHVWLFVTPWIAARQASLSITNSRSSPRLTSIESVVPSSHLILCRPLLLLPPIPPSIRVFSNESTLCMRWPKYWSFSFSIILLMGPSISNAAFLQFWHLVYWPWLLSNEDTLVQFLDLFKFCFKLYYKTPGRARRSLCCIKLSLSMEKEALECYWYITNSSMGSTPKSSLSGLVNL